MIRYQIYAIGRRQKTKDQRSLRCKTEDWEKSFARIEQSG
jgi:hypothetical protein